MKLLIITQKVDEQDDNLGFFHRWIEEFAKRCENVVIICLYEGKHHLPHNVRVLSLGKEGGVSRFKYLRRFYAYIWRERKNYDAVFVHMNPIYVVLGGIPWRLLGKRIGLWYTHGHVDMYLRLAERFTHVIFTASPESFRIPSAKVRVTGHGIDTETLVTGLSAPLKEVSDTLKLVTIGRIAPSKRVDAVIEAVALLKEKGRRVRLSIIGASTDTEEEDYKKILIANIASRGLADDITFVGPIFHKDVGAQLSRADILVSMSDTKSLDKVILEALALGTPVMTSNTAFRDILPEGAFIKDSTPASLAMRIETHGTHPYDAAIKTRLSNEVIARHSLSLLIDALMRELSYVRD